MPNYCTNTLVVSGKDLELFKNEVKGSDGEFSLDSLIPIPNFKNLSFDEIQKILTPQQLKEYQFNENGEVDWYEFCCTNWGTKWDVSNLDFDHQDEESYYHFETAWSPPEPWLITISKRYDCNFELTSYEEGCDFWFHLVIENGEIIENQSMTINEKMKEDFENEYNFKEVKKRFIEKLAELEYDENEETNVYDIEELSEILEQLDSQFGHYSICNYFDNYRKGYYALKKLISKRKNNKN